MAGIEAERLRTVEVNRERERERESDRIVSVIEVSRNQGVYPPRGFCL
jgi:hypothetical protein